MVGIVLENIKTVNRLSYIRIHNLINFKKKQILRFKSADQNLIIIKPKFSQIRNTARKDREMGTIGP